MRGGWTAADPAPAPAPQCKWTFLVPGLLSVRTTGIKPPDLKKKKQPTLRPPRVPSCTFRRHQCRPSSRRTSSTCTSCMNSHSSPCAPATTPTAPDRSAGSATQGYASSAECCACQCEWAWYSARRCCSTCTTAAVVGGPYAGLRAMAVRSAAAARLRMQTLGMSCCIQRYCGSEKWGAMVENVGRARGRGRVAANGGAWVGALVLFRCPPEAAAWSVGLGSGAQPSSSFPQESSLYISDLGPDCSDPASPPFGHSLHSLGTLGHTTSPPGQ